MKTIIFSIALLLGCLFEAQSFGMNKKSQLVSKKYTSVCSSNKHYSCSECKTVLSSLRFRRVHMMRIHRMCPLCENFSVRDRTKNSTDDYVILLERATLLEHLIKCFTEKGLALYICRVCYGCKDTKQGVHFLSKCHGIIEKFLPYKELNSEQDFKVIKMDLSRVQPDHQISQNKLAHKNQHNDRVEPEYYFLNDPTYNSILDSTVCGSLPYSQTDTQSCDVSCREFSF